MAHEERTVRHRFTELDGLRGSAALLVVLFHVHYRFRDAGGPAPLDRLLAGGAIMVDLFFVLSGFVLAHAMFSVGSAMDAARFGLLRYRRFLPLHLTAMAIAFVTALAVWSGQNHGVEHLPAERPFTAASQSPSGYLSALFLLQGVIGPQFAGYKAAWSLSVELWGNVLLVAAIALVPRPRLKPLVGPIALLAGAAILFHWGQGTTDGVGWVASGRGLLGLGAGLSLYRLHVAIPVRAGNSVWASVGALVGTIALGAYMYWHVELYQLACLPLVLVTGLLVFSLAQPSRGPIHRVFDGRVLQWLGSRSFALYALHQPVMDVVVLTTGLHGQPLSRPAVAAFVWGVTLTGSLLAAELGHRFVERLLTPGRTDDRPTIGPLAPADPVVIEAGTRAS